MLKNGHYIKQFNSTVRIIACLVEFKLSDISRIYSLQAGKTHEENQGSSKSLFDEVGKWPHANFTLSS